MGGFNSGGHNRRGYGTVEGHRRLDAVFMQKKGVLRPGWMGTWSWTTGDGERNLINLQGGDERIRLSFRFRCNGGPWSPVEQVVPIDWSPRHYGGSQAYFLCPRCSRRARYLYGADTRFLCSSCYRLKNGSAREGRSDRAWRRVSKLRRRVGAEPGLEAYIPPRPRYMRRARYDAIVDGIEREERHVLMRMAGVLDRIKGARRNSGTKGFWS